MLQISNRLQTVASFVEKGSVLVDVGTDHGYIPIYLVEQGIISKAIAMDINKGPLERADEHIAEYKMQDKIVTRLSDGLNGLQSGEGDTVLIAGMGGALTVRILKDGAKVLETVRELILSPHSEINLVRTYLQESGYKIIKEEMIFDEGKFYTIIKAVHGVMNYNNIIDFTYGKYLLDNRHPVLKDYLKKEYSNYENIMNGLKNASTKAAKERIDVIEELMKNNRKAMEYYRM